MWTRSSALRHRTASGQRRGRTRTTTEVPDVIAVALAGAATALATGVGAVPVFFLGTRAAALRPVLWGLAAGVMAVASWQGLLAPALDEGSSVQVAGGLAAGVAFLA